MKYTESWKIHNDNKNTMDFAIAKAEKIGNEKGLEKGLGLGLEQVAVTMIRSQKYTDEQIQELTGLSLAKIQELRKTFASKS